MGVFRGKARTYMFAINIIFWIWLIILAIEKWNSMFGFIGRTLVIGFPSLVFIGFILGVFGRAAAKDVRKRVMT